MAADSRSKNGVASLAYVAGIGVSTAAMNSNTWLAGTSPAMTTFGGKHANPIKQKPGTCPGFPLAVLTLQTL
jgi:hypothetical protein